MTQCSFSIVSYQISFLPSSLLTAPIYRSPWAIHLYLQVYFHLLSYLSPFFQTSTEVMKKEKKTRWGKSFHNLNCIVGPNPPESRTFGLVRTKVRLIRSSSSAPFFHSNLMCRANHSLFHTYLLTFSCVFPIAHKNRTG